MKSRMRYMAEENIPGMKAEDISETLKNVLDACGAPQNRTPVTVLIDRCRKRMQLYSMISLIKCLAATLLILFVVGFAISQMEFPSQREARLKAARIVTPRISETYIDKEEGIIVINIQEGNKELSPESIQVVRRETGEQTEHTLLAADAGSLSIPYVPESAVYDIYLTDTEEREYKLAVSVTVN